MSPIRIGHISDTHGFHQSIFNRACQKYGTLPKVDAFIISGDFFPNSTRGNRPVEREYQVKWFEQIWYELAKRLDGTPVIVVNGNHDFICLADMIAARGYPVHKITPEGFELFGKKWAGFPHIPYICGEWMYEADAKELDAVTFKTFASDPDILVTHAPPYGILDEKYGYGNRSLTSALTNVKHKISHHFFGHCHLDGNNHIEQLGITFVNSACALQFIEID